jgi:anti-anti-sigma factor
MKLTIRTRQTKANVITVTPKGPVDGNTYMLLDKTITGLLNEPIKVLILDMEGVDFVSSAGVGTIMKAKTSLAKKGAELVMSNVQPQVKKVFEIIRLLPTLGVFQSQEELDDYLATIQKRITEEGD